MKLKEKNRVIGVGMCVLVFLLLMTLPSVIHAGIPEKISYQGYLTDAEGVPVDGLVEMVFSIYSVPTGGKPLWSETQSVKVVAGVYNVVLEVGTPFGKFPKLTFDVPYYLGVKVGEDAEMVPRMALTSVPYAFRAQSVDTVPTHNHDAAYLNATGDSMSAASSGTVLSVSNIGAGYGISGSSTGVSSRGVSGSASGYNGRGVYGYASGYEGRGVYGEAEANEEETVHYGGYFLAKGSNGRGVYGDTDGTSSRGVEGYASGSDGKGVYGTASNSGNTTNYGGFFTAKGTKGRGVYGHADNDGDETNYGGYFIASGTKGRGVYGVANNDGDGRNTGGYFEAHSTHGRGVYGWAHGVAGCGIEGYASYSGPGSNIGGFFEASSVNGVGAYGYATGTKGRGVYGHADGTDGRGVYGHAGNTGDVVNYGGYFEASGWYGSGVYGYASGVYGRGVHGYADGGDAGLSGVGVYGSSSGTSGYGLFGSAKGDSGTGVHGEGGLYDFYAHGSKVNFYPFTGAHETMLCEDFPVDTKPGMIVSVTGQTQLRRQGDGTPSLSSTLPTIKLSSRGADKAVFGVLVAEAPLPKGHWYEAKEGERFASVNALGEGRAWVSNINGDIEVGDYITTSSIPGYGQRQDDDLLHSYTFGKAIEAVDWSSVTETVLFNGREIKVYLIAVTYTSG